MQVKKNSKYFRSESLPTRTIVKIHRKRRRPGPSGPTIQSLPPSLVPSTLFFFWHFICDWCVERQVPFQFKILFDTATPLREETGLVRLEMLSKPILMFTLLFNATTNLEANALRYMLLFFVPATRACSTFPPSPPPLHHNCARLTNLCILPSSP